MRNVNFRGLYVYAHIVLIIINGCASSIITRCASNIIFRCIRVGVRVILILGVYTFERLISILGGRVYACVCVKLIIRVCEYAYA